MSFCFCSPCAVFTCGEAVQRKRKWRKREKREGKIRRDREGEGKEQYKEMELIAHNSDTMAFENPR